MLDTFLSIISKLFIPINTNSYYEGLCYIFGYTYSMVISHVFISKLMVTLSEPIGKKEKLDKLYQPKMIGVLERFIYTSLIFLGKEAFIFITAWLALKIAGNWKSWQDPKKKENGVSGRNIFNVFVIGTGFSVVYGVLGGLSIKWLLKEQFNLVTYFCIFVILFTVFFKIWAFTADK